MHVKNYLDRYETYWENDVFPAIPIGIGLGVSISVNKNPNKKIPGIVLQQEEKIIWKKDSPYLFFQCDKLINGNIQHELYANIFNFKISQAGPKEKLINVVVLV